MPPRDTWQSGAAYEPYVGRWSRLVAREFLAWLAVPPGCRWLDVGCGTGALTETLLRQAQPASVVGVDFSHSFATYAHSHVPDRHAVFAAGNGMALPFRDEAFDSAVSSLALNFIPRQDVALAEMRRVLRPGGAVAVYVWDYASQMQMMRVFWDAAVELDPSMAEQDESRRFPICNPEPLGQLFAAAGLAGVEVRAIDVVTHFRDFDDYWSPFLGGQGSAPTYAMALSEERRAALRERIRSRLPISQDGSIALNARAWAARGSK